MQKPVIKLKSNILESLQNERKINENTLSKISKLTYLQIYRNKNNPSQVSAGFIAGVLTAFPDKKFDDLFFIDYNLSCMIERRCWNVRWITRGYIY